MKCQELGQQKKSPGLLFIEGTAGLGKSRTVTKATLFLWHPSQNGTDRKAGAGKAGAVLGVGEGEGHLPSTNGTTSLGLMLGTGAQHGVHLRTVHRAPVLGCSPILGQEALLKIS